ncbi:NINE protein [Staphylococcus aureus]|nr:NINE protein [Staphylococcus aureus]
MKILKLEILVFTTNLSRIIVKEDLQMKVNKAIYVIVALFLGGLGIHKFYADKFGQGLFHLLFFWTGIPTIISIIHASFVIFTKKADKDGYIIFPKN